MENKATDRPTDLASRRVTTAGAAIERDNDTAGQACRQHAAEFLRSKALAMQLRSQAKIAEAKQCLVDAEALQTRSVQLRELAEEAAHLRGPAEAALWDLAVEGARSSV